MESADVATLEETNVLDEVDEKKAILVHTGLILERNRNMSVFPP